MSKKLTRNVFISSKYRINSNEKPYDFWIYFPRGYLECGEQQQLSINIINFHMPNTMYNINNNNNIIQILIRNASNNTVINNVPFVIDNGNYNVYELRDKLNTLLTNYVSVSYNKIRNTYLFTREYVDGTVDISIKASFAKYLGLEDDVEYPLHPPLESVKPINLVAYNKIVMNCTELDYNIGTIENISSKYGFEISNILFWASRQDVANMAEITYNNEDG